MKKIIFIISTIIFLFLLIIFSLLLYISQKTQRSFSYFPKIIYHSIKENKAPESLNIMILGLDRRNDWLEKTETTDTIIYSQINFIQNKIKLFSLPRDLWDYYTGTKINQIYPLSLAKTNNQDKYAYISDKFASISGQPIDRIIILSTENLKQLADILGGIDIYLEKAFIDSQYPNEAYIQDPKSGAPIYKTIEFKSGWIHLDSSNITEFVRSRKSAETAVSGGTDIGRIERQQQLINALIDKLRGSLTQKPKIIFELYKFWGNLEHNFTDQELITYFLKYGLKLKDISIIRFPISTGEDPKKDMLYHPLKFINSQWVFIPQDKEYQSLKEYISASLVSP